MSMLSRIIGNSPIARFPRVPLVLFAVFAVSLAAFAQQPQPGAPPQPATENATPAPLPASDAAQAPAAAPGARPAEAPATPPEAQPVSLLQHSQPSPISEQELKQTLVGKQFYLRAGYLGDNLNFDEHGRIVGRSPRGSYTLSIVQIDHVRLTKHKVELEGTRFGLHFNEQLAYEDSSKAYDQVRITPNKKVVRITFDREMVVNPKKKKETAKDKGKAVKPALPAVSPAAASGVVGTGGTPASAAPAPSQVAVAPAPADTPIPAQTLASAPAATTAVPVPSSTPDPAAQASSSPAATAPAVAAPSAEPTSEPGEMSDADQLKASIAATPEAERPADPSSVTTTTSQAHANQLLREALDATFAPGLDERMMAAMPDFWKLYYQAVAEKRDYRPEDASVLRQNIVDEKAHLLSSFEPDSNDFAQAAGVAGMALYHTVIGPDGKPGEIAVARPIGFGLDENAVAAIRKAKFSPAMKDGKPVSVMLDLVVQFRIFSNRTAAKGAPETADKDKAANALLPGPYSVPHTN